MPTIELLDGVAQVPPAAWNALVGDESPFLEWEWLASLEDAGVVGAAEGWLPRPLVARDGDRLLAACPVYVKTHSEGEFVFDFAWADAALRAGIRYYPKLLVGVPFTPVTGARFLVARGLDRAAWIRRLGDALHEICTQSGFSGVHVNFCREDELPPFEGSAYLPRVGIQYHWRNEGYASFEDYLSALRSKRRNQVRRERSSVREQEDRGRARHASCPARVLLSALTARSEPIARWASSRSASRWRATARARRGSASQCRLRVGCGSNPRRSFWFPPAPGSKRPTPCSMHHSIAA